jgi:acetyl esterase/lipase
MSVPAEVDLNDPKNSQDPFLQGYVQNTGVLVVSVGYRLAPEDPYPAPAHDCYDVAEWLVQNAEKEFGAPLDFISGEVRWPNSDFRIT